jgi:hypothetical protein
MSAVVSNSLGEQLLILDKLYHSAKIKPTVISCIEMVSQRLPYANNFRISNNYVIPDLIIESIDLLVKKAVESNQDILVSMPLFDSNSRKLLNRWIENVEDIIIILDKGAYVDFNEGFEIIDSVNLFK